MILTLSDLGQVVSAACGFIFGAFCGHWFTLLRDRRREFNDLAAPIRRRMLLDLQTPLPFASRIDELEFDGIRPYLTAARRHRLQRELNHYTEACKAGRQINHGKESLSNPDVVRRHIHVILRLLDRR